MTLRDVGLAKAALAAVLLAAAGTTTVAVRSYRAAGSIAHPPRVRVTPEAAARAFAEISHLENVTLRTSDGLTLRGWFAPGRRRAAVILTHGFDANRTQLYADGSLLARRGYGVLMYDSRGSGESEGDGVTWGDRETRDIEAALDYVVARSDVDRDRVALLGFSAGGSSTTLVAASDARVRAVILYATWSSLEDEMKRNDGKYGPFSWGPILFGLRREGIDVDRVRPIDRIAAIQPRPLLMMAGSIDDNTPLPVMQRLFAAAREPKELWIVDGAKHGGYVEIAPAEYESKVVGFLDRALPADAGTPR